MNNFTLIDFPLDKVTFKPLMKDEEYLNEVKKISLEPETPEKIKKGFGEVYFSPSPTDRPYTFGSIVLSADGKISFTDNRHGDLIAGNNFLDKEGGLGDYWILNILRFYSDGIIIGAKTLIDNDIMNANCFDKELADLRLPYLKKKHYCPTHIVVSFDGTDIPLNHNIFEIDAPLIIGTSPDGLRYVEENSSTSFVILGPYANKEEIDKDNILIKGLLEKKDKQRVLIGTGKDKTTDGSLLLYLLKKLEINRLLIESPSYMTYLMSIKAMDEMFMNYSSVFAAGNIGFGTFLEFGVNDHPHSNFIQVGMHSKNFISTRQKMIYNIVEDNPIHIVTGDMVK